MVTDTKEGYKSTEIGVIPFDWDLKSVEEISDVTTGNKDTQNKSENGKYDFYVRSQKVEKINSYSFDGEAVLTAGDGVGVGKVYHYVNGKFDYHQRVYKISDFKNIDGKFFFYYFSENFMKIARKYNSKTSVDSVRRHMITEMKIPIPSMIEQKKIVEILSSADEQIEKTEQIIEKTKELKKNLMQQLLTKGMEEGKLKLTELGSIPEHWEVKLLKEASTINPENVVSNDKSIPIQYIDIESVKDGKIKSTKPYLLKDAPSRAKRIVKNEDVIVSTVRPYLKAFAKVRDKRSNLVCSTGFAVLRSTNFLDSEYIFQFVNSDIYVNQLINKMRGSNYPAVNTSDIKESKIIVPPVEEQKKIADILLSVDNQIEIYEKEKEKQIELKKALMQQLLTGKIRVTV